MLRSAVLGLLLVSALLLGGCIFGGGDDGPPSVARPGSIPTATPPATLPEPVMLGEGAGTGLPPGATGGPSPGNYVVKSGDTLLGIAGSLGVPAGQQAAWVTEVLRLNSLADAGQLAVGQELRLPPLPTAAAGPTSAPGATSTSARTPTPGAAAPTATRPPTTPAAGSTPALTPSAGGGAGTYTVVSGDYPLLIAQKLNVPEAQQSAWAAQLVTLNNINPSALSVGQVLQLPPIPR
jgi:LysM repeat protein